MKIRYETGDALKGPERFTCHGCNSRGVMGSGIALQVRTDYPEAYRAYINMWDALSDRSAGLPLGDTIWVKCRDGRTIINAITQRDFGRDKSIVYVSYDAIRKVIRTINAQAIVSKSSDAARTAVGVIDAVALPTIGAGLANGSWRIISEIIEEEAKDFEPVVYLFDGKMPQS